MAFYKKNKKDSMIRTIFSNTFEPPYVNSVKKFYSFIEIGGKDHYFEYEGKFRSEAEAHFLEQARLNGGKFTTVHAFKN